jgi:hypothetical protein
LSVPPSEDGYQHQSATRKRFGSMRGNRDLHPLPLILFAVVSFSLALFLFSAFSFVPLTLFVFSVFAFTSFLFFFYDLLLT